MRHVAFVSLVAVGVGVVACSGGAGSSCGSLYDAVIAHANQCGTSTLGLDPSSKASFESYCDGVTKAPGVNDFSAQVDQCTSAVQSTACNTTVSCKIAGSLADGTACGVSFQCSGGLCDNANTVVPSSEVTCGKCASYVAPGGSCGNGTLCDPATAQCVNGTCVAVVQQGGSCQSAPCASGLQCDATAHTCQPYPTKGQTCTSQCASGLVCDQQSKTCVDPTLAASGQPCGIVNSQFVVCQPGLTCQNNTCVAVKNAGEACNVGKHECAPYLLCVSGTCQVPDYSVCK